MNGIDFPSLLITLSFVFLILEVAFASRGIFTFIGLCTFIIGTYLLYIDLHTLPPIFLYAVMPIFFVAIAFVVFVITLGMKAQKTSIKTTENLVGRSGICSTMIKKDSPGEIEIEGETWTAYSKDTIQVGDKVKIIAQKSLKLNVQKEDQ